MKSVGLLLCCLLVCAQIHAQALHFQATQPTDSVGLSRSIRDLAGGALDQQQGPEQETEPSNRFLLQLATEQYTDATNTFAAWRAQHPAQGFDQDILLELFGKTKAAEATEHLPLEEAFGRAFAAVFRELGDKAALDSEYFLQTPPGVFRQQLEQLLEQFKGRQSLALADALSLIRAYLTMEAQQSIAPYLNAAEARDDQRRYTIDSQVLIKTRDGATLSAIVVRRKGTREPQPASLRFTIYVDPLGLYLAKVAAIHDYAGCDGQSRSG